MSTIQERAKTPLSPTNTFGFSAEKIAATDPNDLELSYEEIKKFEENKQKFLKF